MSDIRDPSPTEAHPLRTFTRALLDDLQALERMIEAGLFESGVRRIGAEQEMFLVDRGLGPAMTALEVLRELDHPQVKPELGLFNLEINLSPRIFGADCLRRLENEAEELIASVSRAARLSDARVLLAGILPTLKQKDLTLDAMTPQPRYAQLNRSTLDHRGGVFRMQIKGLDELNVSHDNVMFEACNTSFQVHFQVDHEEFARLYNLAQAITGPVLAAAVNSPVFLQHRLWNETRVALFEQSVDSRSDAHHARHARPRVIFGDHWVESSVLEIFREDIARFRVFLPAVCDRPSLSMLERGEVPPLAALCMHNGTVYRWNRPCYGVQDGKPHLRIEHRALPAGPTVIDEIANAAFFCGLMSALSEEHEDITRVMPFDAAKRNFMAAARYGLEARFQWLGNRAFAADRLILDELLPLARRGLGAKGIDPEDVERYLGVLEERVRSGRTGAQWALDSLAAMGDLGRPDERYRALAACMHESFLEGRPVHEWKPARLDRPRDWRNSCRYVEQVMTTDLFTVRSDDLVDFAASLMDWEHIRHVPVEDEGGFLVGLVTHRQLLRLLSRGESIGGPPVAVREIMRPDPVTAHPDTTTAAAIEKMRKHRVSCLPVVDRDNKLVGIVSERDFIHVAAHLLDEFLGDP